MRPRKLTTGELSGRDRKKVRLAEGVLREAGVELHRVLQLKEGLDVESHGLLRDQEGQALRAWRGRERATVLKEGLSLEVVDEFREIESAGLGDGAR